MGGKKSQKMWLSTWQSNPTATKGKTRLGPKRELTNDERNELSKKQSTKKKSADRKWKQGKVTIKVQGHQWSKS